MITENRKINVRRFYNMNTIVKEGVMTEEQADKIQDMLASSDYEMQRLGKVVLEPFRQQYFDKRCLEYHTFGKNGKII